MATAVYLMPLPAEAQSLTIDVGYQPQDTARDKRVAGFLFVRNRDVERQYAAADSGKTGPFDEPGFYGDTYLLPAGQVRAIFDIPAADAGGDNRPPVRCMKAENSSGAASSLSDLGLCESRYLCSDRLLQQNRCF